MKTRLTTKEDVFEDSAATVYLLFLFSLKKRFLRNVEKFRVIFQEDLRK